MVGVTIRNLPDDAHRALTLQASEPGRSTEADIRDIPERAIRPETPLRIGSAIGVTCREAGITNKDVEALRATRDRTPAQPMSFE